jgi:hypothetical protein
MQEDPSMILHSSIRSPLWSGFWKLCGCCVAAAALTGCAGIRAPWQELVNKPNMLYSDSLVFRYQGRLPLQVEPGSALSNGTQAGGASCCK